LTDKVLKTFIYRDAKLKRPLTVQIAIAEGCYEAFCVSVTIFWGVSPFDVPVPTFRSDLLPSSSG